MSLTLTKKPTKSELIKLLAKEYNTKEIYYKTKLNLLLEILDNELKSTKNHIGGYSKFLKLDIGESLQYLVFNQKYHRDCFKDEIKCDCSICEDYKNDKYNIGADKLGKYGDYMKIKEEEEEEEDELETFFRKQVEEQEEEEEEEEEVSSDEIDVEEKEIDGVVYYWEIETNLLYDKNKWVDNNEMVKVGKLGWGDGVIFYKIDKIE